MNRAAFLDRDGVINRKAHEGEYITRWEDVEILPGVSEAIASLNRAGFRVIVVTNQRCVAKGLITIAELEMLHQKMCGRLKNAGAVIDAVYYCPHENEPKCGCRKPAPGMLLDAARDHSIDLNVSWMIGDSEADVEAGRQAGCKTALVAGNHKMERDQPELVVPSLLVAAEEILLREGISNSENDRVASEYRQQ
ncbi:MAG TPA: HAD family hydrolase [Terriglobales bacterium]|jgi:D-glycero-D-manno-heptose 1,7-bisphosphate phosphatase|nr:HAD family hydrolase [Terriglobales bacterium]